MKKILTLIVFISSIQILAQDTSITQYFPLKIGNIWVYQHSAFGNPPCYCVKKIKVMVTDTNIYNGKTYFQCQVSNIIVSCPSTCGMGFLPYDSLMRIDSATGNVLRYAPGSGCITPNETLLDSLKARKNDTIKIYCQPPVWYYTYVCSDTSSITIFGLSKEARRFSIVGFEGGWARTYAKGIGLIRYNCGVPFCNSQTQLQGCVINGVVYGDTGFVVGINQISSEIPEQFALSQNYPNPFNPTTNIKFQVPKSGLVKLAVYDLLGKEIQTIVNQQLSPGTYEVDFNGSNLPSGIYYYKLQADEYSETKKMVLIK
jgi:hypothetical protein